MSYIAFHSPTKTLEIGGLERAYAGCLARDLMCSVLPVAYCNMHPAFWEKVFGHVLRKKDRENEFTLRAYLNGDKDFLIEGKFISTFSVALNTMYRMGNSAMKLLARLHGQCEVHCWVDGKNRAWLADIIERGRKDRILRERYSEHYTSWEELAEFLRSNDSEPVVTSYSVCRFFPNHKIAQWTDNEDGDAFYSLSYTQQWDLAMQKLREEPTLELTPDNWDTYHFSSGVSAFDIMEIMRL